MNDLIGLPDFQSLIANVNTELYAPYGSGSHTVVPRQLSVARDGSGLPKFQLALVKRVCGCSAGAQYSVLDFSVAGDFGLDAALCAAREHAPDATVRPLAVNLGFARMYPTTAAVPIPADLSEPCALGWSGTDLARWTMRLKSATGELLKAALTSAALPLGARLEFDARGVCARIAGVVQFDPAQLLAFVVSGMDRRISVTDVRLKFTGLSTALPLRFLRAATSSDADLFAQIMTDRLVTAYGSLIPAPGPNDPPYVLFEDVATSTPSQVSWDLSEPVIVRRAWAYTLDPIADLQCGLPYGLASLVKDVAIPALNLGFTEVDIAANLPANRVGVPAIGVNIELPLNPPFRPAAISETATFNSPEDEAAVNFQLSPAEALAYNLSCFAVVAAGTSVWPFDSPARAMTSPWVQLQPSDFPVTFAHITAADRLLAIATLSGVLSYVLDGKPVQQSFRLTQQQPDLAVAVPQTATGGAIAITGEPLDGSGNLALPSMAPGRIDLDVTLFAQYGPHRIKLSAQLTATDAPLQLELQSEQDALAGGTAITTYVLLPAQPTADWGYVAMSPFHAGYRYRLASGTGQPLAAWSTIQSPFANLSLDRSGSPMAMQAPAGALTAQIVEPQTISA